MALGLFARPEVVVGALLLVEDLRGQQPVVEEGVAAGVVAVGGLREGADMANVVECVVAEDAVGAPERVGPGKKSHGKRAETDGRGREWWVGGA